MRSIRDRYDQSTPQTRKWGLYTVAGGGAIGMHELVVPTLHIDNNLVSDALSALVFPAVLEAREHITQIGGREYDVAATMLAGGRVSRSGKLSGEATANGLQYITDEGEVDVPLLAKYWILYGKPPDSDMHASIMEAIAGREVHFPRGTPLLSTTEALRILGASLVVLRDEDRKIFEHRADKWAKKMERLSQQLTEARFAMAALREERAGFPVSDASMALVDVATQDEISKYFFMTGATPDGMTGTELRRCLRVIGRGRAHLDATMARKAALVCAGIRDNHPALMPLRPLEHERWRTFPTPWNNDEANQDDMATYREIMENPHGVYASVATRDGWHVIRCRTPHDDKGQQSIVAARDGQAVRITGQFAHMRRTYEMLVMDRANDVLTVHQQGVSDTYQLAVNLKNLADSAKQNRDPDLEYTWPHALYGESWAECISAFNEWTQRIPELARRGRTKAAMARMTSAMTLS